MKMKNWRGHKLRKDTDCRAHNMSTDTTRPATVTSPSTATSAINPTRRSYRCYHCSYSFHITTANSSPLSPSSSFRCPSCHHRHLLPHHAISPAPPPPPPPLPSPPNPNPIVIVIPSRITSYETEISSSDDDDDDNDSLFEFVSGNSKTTPTSKSFLRSLPSIKITLSDLKSSQSCPICMDDLGVDSDANQLPCQHLFHKDCIVEWLHRSNTCPLCRYKLPEEPGPVLGPGPSPSPEEFVPRFDGRGENNYYELQDSVLRPAQEVIRRVIRRSSGTGSGAGLVSGSGLRMSFGRWAAREFGADEQIREAIVDVSRDADGDTLMADA